MKQLFTRMTILWLLVSSLMLACSLTIPTTSAPESEYRYDDLPDKANESQAFSEYRAISKWDSLDITYFFENGTDKLGGDVERDLIRRAFALWSEQTPLTFIEVSNLADADIAVDQGSWRRRSVRWTR